MQILVGNTKFKQKLVENYKNKKKKKTSAAT